MAGYVYKPPAFIAGLVRHKQAQQKNTLIIMATTYAVALLIGGYAIFAPADKTGVLYSARGNGPDYSSSGQLAPASQEAGDSAERTPGRTISSTNLLRGNPRIVRDSRAAPTDIDITMPEPGDFGWATGTDLMPGVSGGSDLVFASDSYGDVTSAGGDVSLPGRAMWEWTERSAQIIVPPRITPAYMKPTVRLRHPRKAAGIDGWVALRFKIGKGGVYDLEVLVEDPPGLGFAAAVRSYIESCYIWPAKIGDRPIVTEVQATFRVCLNCRAEAKTSGNLVFHQEDLY